ncbi:hypothetical protein D3C86_1602600 [compost metagenome]
MFKRPVYSSVLTRTSRTRRTTSCSRSGNCLMLLPMRLTSFDSEAICRSMDTMLGWLGEKRVISSWRLARRSITRVCASTDWPRISLASSLRSMVPRLLRKALYLVSAASSSPLSCGSCCSRNTSDFSACADLRFTFCCTYSWPIWFRTAVVSAGSLPSSVTPITPDARPRSKIPMCDCTFSIAARRELRDTVNSVPGRPASASTCTSIAPPPGRRKCSGLPTVPVNVAPVSLSLSV